MKFAYHFAKWPENKRLNEKMRTNGHDIFTESDAVHSFFNGASDHLYEIEIPEGWERKKVGKKIKELQDFGLMIGHSFTERQHSEEDVNFAYDLCNEIAVLIDKELGLKPDTGQWA